MVRVYDPAAMENAQGRFADIICCSDPYEAAQGADALMLMTEWNEFRNMDLPRIRAALGRPRLLDCRNIYDPREMQELGFEYVSVGRPTREPGDTPEDDVSEWHSPRRLASYQSEL